LKHNLEVDGLRALAVTSVLIFHFYPNIMPYGYLGVDIFFVISGFLITLHLLKIDNTNISNAVIQFLTRRLNRLLPALFFFFLISTIFVSYLFLKPDIEKFHNSLISAQTFWSNIYFWRDGGYFGGSDKIKPLLHTWSLSVEIQFYFLFSIFIFLLYFFNFKNKKLILFSIIFITILSYLIWIYLIEIGGNNPAFFLFPSRFWQFGFGSILACLFLFRITERITYNIRIILTAGAIIFLTAALFFDINFILKSLFAALGATLFIASVWDSNNNAMSIFRNKTIVGIGTISYSIYLYHWLIGVLALYYFIDDIPIYVSLLSIFLSIMFGYLSYTFIESKFRYNASFISTLLFVAFCSVISLSILESSKKEENLTISDKWSYAIDSNFRCEVASYFKYGPSRACLIDENIETQSKIVILGNSHAQMYAPIFKNITDRKKYNTVLIPLNGCLPTISVNINKECIYLAKGNLKTLISDQNVRHVFISMTWYDNEYYDINGSPVNQLALLESVDNLIQILKDGQKEVSLISPIAIPYENLASILPRKIRFSGMTISEALSEARIDRSEFEEKFSKVNNYYINKLKFNYIRPYEDLCDQLSCFYAKEDQMYFSDGNHLSKLSLNILIKTKGQIKHIIENSVTLSN